MTTSYQILLSNCLGSKAKCLPELKKTFARPLIQIAVKTIEQEHIEEGILNRISQKYNIRQENIDEFYAAIFTILKTYLRFAYQSVKPAEFKQSLEELKLSPDCIEDLSTVLYGQKRADLLLGLSEKTKFYPCLTSCKWRIDIVISSSVLNKVLEPNIIMEWTFDTGEYQTFELSLSKFHQFRHAVATVLVEMQTLEQHSNLKNIYS